MARSFSVSSSSRHEESCIIGMSGMTSKQKNEKLMKNATFQSIKQENCLEIPIPMTIAPSDKIVIVP